MGNFYNKFCLFKLSDLGLFKAFPLIFIKRGLTIRLNLSLDYNGGVPHAFVNLSPSGAGYTETGKIIRFEQPRAKHFFIKPDEAHLAMLRQKLEMDGVVRIPVRVFEGSYDKRMKSQNDSTDVSSSASLVERTFVTFVNKSETDQAAWGAYEITEEAKGTYQGNVHEARFCPPINAWRMQISGSDYPSADGLNSTDAAQIQYYTETIEGMSTGVSLNKYQFYKFYTVFDYTGHQNLFIVPQITVDAGEKVQS